MHYKKSCLFLCALLGASSCTVNHAESSPGLHTISIIDRNGMSEVISNPDRIKQYRAVDFLGPQPYEKVVCIHSRLKNGNIPSFLYSYHENGQPKQYLEVINSRAQGTYKEWFPNGQQKLVANVIGGEADLAQQAARSWMFDGIAYAWDEAGNLQAEISYEKGVLCGNSVYYHPEGTIWKIVPFKAGKIDGVSQIFLKNGELFQTSTFVDGKIHGSSMRYWPGQKIAIEEEFKDDRLLFGNYYDSAGNQISQIRDGNGFKAFFGRTSLVELHEFRHGVAEGEVKIFDKNQKLHRVYFVKNNQKHGEDLEYYEESHLKQIPKLLVTWYEGKIQGISKTWYDNGVQESSREMSQNAKNGMSIAWYRDGSLMLLEEYQNDKLLKGEYYRRGEKRPISEVKQGSGIATIFDPEGNFLHKVIYQNSVPGEGN